MDELRIDLENAIPRPGRSQVLRSAPNDKKSPGELIQELLQGVSMKVWAVVLAVVVAGGLGLLELRKMGNSHPQQTVQTPASTATAPTSTQTTSTGASGQSNSSGSTATGTQTPGNTAPGATAPGNGTTATGSGTEATTKAASSTGAETAVKPKNSTTHDKQDTSDNTDTAVSSAPPAHRHAYSTTIVDMMQSAASDKPKKHKKPRAIAASTESHPAASKSDPWASLRHSYDH